MKLPHLDPLIFAKEVIKKEENFSRVLCEFKDIPNLAVFIEAAAQSSSSFVDSATPKRGFLATLKDVEQHKELDRLKYHVDLKLETKVGDFQQFYFEVHNLEDDTTAYISGNFTVVIQEV